MQAGSGMVMAYDLTLYLVPIWLLCVFSLCVLLAFPRVCCSSYAIVTTSAWFPYRLAGTVAALSVEDDCAELL